MTQKQTRVPTNPATVKRYDDALPQLGDSSKQAQHSPVLVPVRYFIFDYEMDDGEGDIRECSEAEFNEHQGTLSYERHTVRENGVSQICLTKI